MEKKYCMTKDNVNIALLTVAHDILAFAAQYSDDPETLAIHLADATTLVMGLAELELTPILDRMTKTYPSAVRAGVSVQGYPNTTQ